MVKVNNLPDFLHRRESKIKLGHKRILRFLDLLDNPHNKLKAVIHIAGTNGKGSILAFLESILKSSSYLINKYTSPHFLEITERYIVENKEIKANYLTNIFILFKTIDKSQQQLSFFEGITAAAFYIFNKTDADFNLIETGLGGRFDATNIIDKPLVNIISMISYDHMDILGNSIKEITLEKIAIIKKGTIVILAKQQYREVEQLVKDKANSLNASFFYVADLVDIDYKNHILRFFYQEQYLELKINLPLLGEHQLDNLATAIVTIIYAINPYLIKLNLPIVNVALINILIKNTIWGGRLERIFLPKKYEISNKWSIIADIAHNQAGAIVINNWLKANNFHKVILITAMKTDKDWKRFYLNLSNITEIYSLKIEVENVEMINYIELSKNLNELFKNNNIIIKLADNIIKIFEDIKSNYSPNEKILILFAGSLFLIANLKKWLSS